MDPVETHIVPSLPTPIRIQEYGIGIFNSVVTKSALKKVLKKKLIMVNDTIATTATFIHGGEHIELLKPQEAIPKKKLILPLKVLYEDDHIAVIHKPAGILVSGSTFKTVSRALTQNIRSSSATDATLPQPVHRLDYATTGALLVGKTSGAIRALNQLFEAKSVEKTYYAIAIGSMNAHGEITTPVGEKDAKSMYSVIKTVPSKRFEKLNLVKLEPLTGRTHQLRKHLAGMGHPILGDQEYGKDQLILKGKGLYLHARSLGFTHPFTKENLTIKSPVPQKFKKIFSNHKCW